MPTTKIETRFFLGAAALIAVIACVILWPYLNVLVLAATVAVIFDPVCRAIARFLRLPDGLAAFLTLIIIVVVFVVPVGYFGTQVVREAAGLYSKIVAIDSLPGFVDGSRSLSSHVISDRLPPNLARLIPEKSVEVAPLIQAALGWIVGKLGSVFSTLTSLVIGIFILLMSIYYMLKDGRRFMRGLADLSPLERQYTKLIADKVHVAVQGIVRGSLLVALIQGVLAGVGFLIFGVPNATLWAAVTMVVSLIPNVGSAATTIPAVLYLLLVGNTLGAVGLLCWGILIVGMVDNVLRQQLIRGKTNLHPFLVFLAVIGGLDFFGPIGLITGPLILALLLACVEIYQGLRDAQRSS